MGIKTKDSPLILKKVPAFRRPVFQTCAISALITFLIVLFTYVVLGFAPFSDKALIYKDGQHQLCDLLCWFKDVLNGQSSISYSFSKYLGGSNFAVFSYYMASPLNLLMFFFPKSEAPLFMNILFLLKASLAALFAAYYINRRFHPDNKTKYGITIMLAVSYAFSQYLIAQSNVIMWLDGAYMLPLILAGVEKLVNKKKSGLFIISTALALCFNWYTGIIDLMFAGMWFLFESARVAVTSGPVEADDTSTPSVSRLRSFIYSVIRFSVSCVSTLMIAAIILLPTLTLLSGRSYGKSGIGMLTDFSMIGFIPNVISNYSFGYISVQGGVNLFAGSFVLFGTVLLFTSSAKALKEKLLYGIFLLAVILTFYFQPLVALFSMLREVESLWYRYSYIGSFALVYFAAMFYLECDKKKLKLWMPACIAAVFCVIVFLMSGPETTSTAELFFSIYFSDIIHCKQDTFLLPLISKMVFPILTAALLCLIIYLRRKKSPSYRTAAVLMAGVLFLELALSQMVLSEVYSTSDAPYMWEYTENELELLDSIDDPTFYRIVQTSYHSYHHELAASYCEPMAYGFHSVTAFVSAPDENAVSFLNKAGYAGYYDTIPVTESENLALDSLLSVKYVLLPYGDENYAGLQKIASIEGFKDLYLNPYAVPAVFMFHRVENFESTHDHEPALYLNDLYRYLSCVEKDVFAPADFTSSRIDNTEGTDDKFPAGIIYHYEINSDSDKYIPYANLITNTESGATLYMNGEPCIAYSKEMAPSMVRVLSRNGKATLDLVFTGPNASEAEVVDAQIYNLDLSILDEAVTAIRSTCDEIKYSFDEVYSITSGECKIEANNNVAGNRLFISIPYDKGWQMKDWTLDDQYDLIEDTFFSVPIELGTTRITMYYVVPNIAYGIWISFFGLVLLGMIIYMERDGRKKKVRNTEPSDDASNDVSEDPESDQN